MNPQRSSGAGVPFRLPAQQDKYVRPRPCQVHRKSVDNMRTQRILTTVQSSKFSQCVFSAVRERYSFYFFSNSFLVHILLRVNQIEPWFYVVQDRYRVVLCGSKLILGVSWMVLAGSMSHDGVFPPMRWLTTISLTCAAPWWRYLVRQLKCSQTVCVTG